jgi:hypothetical protein
MAFAQCNFGSSVHFLDLSAPYDPSSGLTPPAGQPIPQTWANDLDQAFAIAPPAFQDQLCRLNGVFIDPTSCGDPVACFGRSWGLSQRRYGHGKYIALSVGFWANPSPSYAQYESALMQSVLPLPLPGATYSSPQSCAPFGVCSGANTFAMTLLAALAHEMGHIRWYDLVDPNPANFCADATGNFFSESWSNTVHRPPPWRDVLTPGERNRLRHAHQWPDSHAFPPYIDDIDNSSGSTRANLIYGLLVATQPWASGLAAISPDEDFVETYKFKVLTTAQSPLTSVKITVPGIGAANIAVDYFNALVGSDNRKIELVNKVNCIPDSL